MKMSQKTLKFLKKNDGLTISELLVTIAIMSVILLAVAQMFSMLQRMDLLTWHKDRKSDLDVIITNTLLSACDNAFKANGPQRYDNATLDFKLAGPWVNSLKANEPLPGSDLQNLLQTLQVTAIHLDSPQNLGGNLFGAALRISLGSNPNRPNANLAGPEKHLVYPIVVEVDSLSNIISCQGVGREGSAESCPDPGQRMMGKTKNGELLCMTQAEALGPPLNCAADDFILVSQDGNLPQACAGLDAVFANYYCDTDLGGGLPSPPVNGPGGAGPGRSVVGFKADGSPLCE